MRRTAILAIACAAFSVMVATGIRQSFGLFLIPISETLGTGRQVYSLALAINSLIYGLPLVAFLADWIGPRWVIAGGGLLYALGLGLMPLVSSPLALYGTIGVMVGFALSATAYVVVLGAVAQLVPSEQRSRAFGFVTAAGSSGMFVLPPLAQWLIRVYGWQGAFLALAGVTLIILALGLAMPGRARTAGFADDVGVLTEEEPLLRVLNRARSHSGYLLLTVGFFVCGFHVSFIATHLPAYLTDNGLSEFTGATALSLVGGFNIVGSYLFGYLGDFYRKKYLLSFLYGGRAIVILVFLLLPLSQFSALAFAGTMGFLWLATVPLTSGTVAQIFGTRYLASLYGFVFFSHQIGAFTGIWLGGVVSDATGSYDPIWYTAIALGVLAALVHLPISDAPSVQTSPAPS